MSSARNRISRTLHWSLPLFLPLFLLQVFFIVAVFTFIRAQLHEYCLDEVRFRLDKYLFDRSAGALQVSGSMRKNDGLHGLSFVRVVSSGEQFLYAENQDLKVNFEGMLNLDPKQSAVWTSLDGSGADGSWTLVSKVLDNGLVIQAGMEFVLVEELFRKLKAVALAAAVAASAIAGGMVFFCRKRMVLPLRTAENAVARIVNKESGELLDAGKKHELSKLYDLFNRLISQNKQLVKEMQSSLDNVAHDLRTPMTRLRSVAEYGLQQNSIEHLSVALSDCLEESERVLAMLNIMMSVAEAESGTMQLRKEAVSLSATIKDVINLYEYVAEEKNISMEIHAVEGIVVAADKTRITQVWANIVDNAIKYGRTGGYLKIYGSSSPRSLSVFFEDNGMGISAGELPRIWERLFRGDRSRSQQGLGLGLNYVRAVVEAHGGAVSVASRLGEGSCFEVRLPLLEEHLLPDQPREKSQIRGA